MNILCLLAMAALQAPSHGQGVIDTAESSNARIRAVGLDEVRWTRGFWADRFALCRDQMVPSMGTLMAGTNYSQYLQNFVVAAGMTEGRHRGAQFNDGDFYKWLEGACAVFAVTRDPALGSRIEEIVGVIARAQRADGYLHTPALIHERLGEPVERPFQNPLHFEMYNMGHLLTAACMHHRVTGRTNFLSVAIKVADFLDRTVSRPTAELAHSAICPSHYMGVVELYRVTRNPRHLALAKNLFALRDLVADGTDDNQDRIPFAQQTTAAGHAVRANYLYAGAADLFAETGDPALWTPLMRIWTNAVEQKMYITGACGALYDGASPDGAKNQKTITRVHQAYGRNYQLPNLAAHNETCANIGNVMWNWRMFLVTGEARFMDVAELALYNSVLSGVSQDGTNFCYVNPLRVLETSPAELRWSRTRVAYVSSFCCPPNLVRTLAETGGYAYGKSMNAIWVNLYGANTLTTTLPSGQRIRLTQETDYPWEGHIRIVVNESESAKWALRLRIPGWAAGSGLKINGVEQPAETGTERYRTITREWRVGDLVELDLPMPAKLMEANPLVEEALNQTAVKRGPLVYCLESADLPPGTKMMDVTVPANLNLVVRRDPKLSGGVVVLDGTLLACPHDEWGGRLFRERKPKHSEPIASHFIPYFAWGNRGVGEMSVWLPVGGNGQ